VSPGIKLDSIGTVGIRYEWVGKRDGRAAEDPYGFIERIARDGNASSISAARDQFVVAARSYLAIGASHAEGCNAIRLDSDMRVVNTGVSDTFDNPPLITQKKRPQSAFAIGQSLGTARLPDFLSCLFLHHDMNDFDMYMRCDQPSYLISHPLQVPVSWWWTSTTRRPW
jgi:hypothetical protein